MPMPVYAMALVSRAISSALRTRFSAARFSSICASEPAAIIDGVYKALRETFEVPEKDLFAVVHQHDADEFVFDANYFGFNRSDRLVIIQLTVANTRGVTQKKKLYAAIVENLMKEPGLKPDDIFINLVEVKREDWSFGGGIAQYVA